MSSHFNSKYTFVLLYFYSTNIILLQQLVGLAQNIMQMRTFIYVHITTNKYLKFPFGIMRSLFEHVFYSNFCNVLNIVVQIAVKSCTSIHIDLHVSDQLFQFRVMMLSQSLQALQLIILRATVCD